LWVFVFFLKHSVGQGQKQPKPKVGPNPLRRLGDAMREFRRKVADKESLESKQSPENEGEDDPASAAAAEDQEVQYADDGKEQALGDATEDQKQKHNVKEEEEDQDDNDVQPMDESDDEEEEEVVGASDTKVSAAVMEETRPPPDATNQAAAPVKQKELEEIESKTGARDLLSERGFGALAPMDEDEDNEEEDAVGNLQQIEIKNADELRLNLEQRVLDEHELTEGARMWRE
jgi:midasin